MLLTDPCPSLAVTRSSLKIQPTKKFVAISIRFLESGDEMYSGLLYINFCEIDQCKVIKVQDFNETSNGGFTDFNKSTKLDQVQSYTNYNMNISPKVYAIAYELNSNDDINLKEMYKTDSRVSSNSYDEDVYALLSSVKSLNLSWDTQCIGLDKIEYPNVSPVDPSKLNDTIIYSEDELNQDMQEILVVDAVDTNQPLDDDDNAKSQNQPPSRNWGMLGSNLIDDTKTEACEQLMLLDNDSNKHTNTIIYTGDESSGETIQEIEVNDPDVECRLIKTRAKNQPPSRNWGMLGSNLIDDTKTEACEQLMLLDNDSNKHTNTIIYTGDESSGETIQEIEVNDPDVECRLIKTRAKKFSAAGQNKKKYQCNKCKQCFNTMPSFKLHLVDMMSKTQKGRKTTKKPENSPTLCCEGCGKTFHCPKKLEKHISGHGNPDRECEICDKVFASKSSLRTHRAIHLRKYQCENCPKTFSKQKDLTNHQVKAHSKYDCTECSFSINNFKVFQDHKQCHEETELLEELFKEDDVIDPDTFIIHPKDLGGQSSPDSGVILYREEISSPEQEPNYLSSSPEQEPNYLSSLPEQSANYLSLDSDLENVDTSIFDNIDDDLGYTLYNTYPDMIENDELFSSINQQEASTNYSTETADSIMELVRMDSSFFSDMKYKRTAKGKYKKTCSICTKSFERMTDLKRHYIEHIVHCTLAKNPTNSNGYLALKCEFCDGNVFDKIETYKEHLREHAKLTNYKCILCNKSFSDSSNFAKHKKVHRNDFFECDLCHRKFTSKKMLVKHMLLHENTEPIKCIYCGKEFFFESILKKHCKTKHTKSIVYKCFFCSDTFKNLKHKWDHEWKIHNSRKTAIDCTMCNKKFRKYSDLKKHCSKTHNSVAPKNQKK